MKGIRKILCKLGFHNRGLTSAYPINYGLYPCKYCEVKPFPEVAYLDGEKLP